MTRGRVKHIHLALMVGISLFIPLFLAYSVYVNLSGTRRLSSDMSFEDSGNEELSTYQNEFRVLVSTVSSDPTLTGTYFEGKLNPIILFPLTFITQNTPVLRC